MSPQGLEAAPRSVSAVTGAHPDNHNRATIDNTINAFLNIEVPPINLIYIKIIHKVGLVKDKRTTP